MGPIIDSDDLISGEKKENWNGACSVDYASGPVGSLSLSLSPLR